MPIRINLLAEAQAAEEMRRKDPVKRAIRLGAIAVAAVLLWYVSLLMGFFAAKSEQTTFETQFKPLEIEEKEVRTTIAAREEVDAKLDQLNQLATNRFLWAPVLNALQQVYIENVQVIEFKADQSYELETPPPPKAKAPAPPPTSTEKISFIIEAKDYTPHAPNHQRYRDAVASHPFFKSLFETENPDSSVGVFLRGQTLRPIEQDIDGRNFRRFSLECVLPRTIRQ